MRTRWGLIGALGLSQLAPPALADVWDTNTERDNDSFTDNQISHGALQVHDLSTVGGVADEDWYRVETRPYSSYEFVIEGFTGDLSLGGPGNPSLSRIASDGTTVLGNGVGFPGTFAYALTMRWQNATAAGPTETVRVAAPACLLACATDDQYTARFWETSTSIARFNNSGTQVTVLLLQNPASYTINGTVFYWNTAGGLVASAPFSVGAKQLSVIATAGAAPGASGSITLTQDGRYGDLQGKTVALEPSTGFSFDTPMVYRPY